MAVDFSDMLDDDDDKVIHPREVFFTLTRAKYFSFPRDIQTEVLNRWFEEKDAPDNVIKLNVGSGKTVVGLLILQSALNEGVGPALYVTPDKQLAQQVMDEAKALGIEVTEDPRDAAYTAGEKICVVNVYKLFNGKSVFGVGASRINIGTVIIDDAHACISTISEQFRISLPHTHPAYAQIVKILEEDLRGYADSTFLDVEAGDPRTYLEVPFWSWDAHHAAILKALHDHRDSDDLQFSFPLVRSVLKQSRCFIGGQYLEIEPYFPATDLIQSFRRAKRRIYMTATLADDSVIATHFGANPDKIGQPIVPASSQSMGERMIIMPQELNPDLTTADVRAMAAELSQTVNVVVIVPSSTAAEAWADDADQVLIGDSVVDGIDSLRKGHVGLTILVNRYDGIDLPDDACRVLIIADLPEVNSYAARVDAEVLSGTAINLRRQIERIEQGMGRGVRSNDDFCAVLLLGPGLTGRIRSQEGQNMLTPATSAQLALSRKIAKKLKDPSLDDIKSVVRQCLDRDSDWVKVSKKALIGIKADDELRLDPAKLALRAAFDSARGNQHLEAITGLDKAIDKLTDAQVKAWMLARKAAFQHPIDAEGAQHSLAAAHRIEPGVLKPLHGDVYKQLAPSTSQQAAALIAFHNVRFMDATSMELFVNALCSDLQFIPNTSDKFEAAIHDLGNFLGVSAQRPEKDYKEGPDNLWALPNASFVVIECKNGVTAKDGIAKKDAGQLGQ